MSPVLQKKSAATAAPAGAPARPASLGLPQVNLLPPEIRATRAFATVKRWLRVFIERFFQNQFKRSVAPDGPKVGSVSLSPRGDWRMPSDASARAFLAELAAAD